MSNLKQIPNATTLSRLQIDGYRSPWIDSYQVLEHQKIFPTTIQPSPLFWRHDSAAIAGTRVFAMLLAQ